MTKSKGMERLGYSEFGSHHNIGVENEVLQEKADRRRKEEELLSPPRKKGFIEVAIPTPEQLKISPKERIRRHREKDQERITDSP